MAENSSPNNSSNFLKNLIGSLYIDRELNAIELDQAIKKDIDYRGYNAWILGASILIASIGLNINSTAVVYRCYAYIPFNGAYFRYRVCYCY